ncbi:MAG: acyl-CoA dehydrogenase family protein [Nitriliruptorales bacterium]|nr:acyl-CoA dehydrogenase family protein [Nitriliruptorales bacterium]
MDFSLSEEQQALRDLAASVFTDLATHDRLTKLEADNDTVFDRDTWAALAQAGILGTVVPEEHGGAGLGRVEQMVVAEEQGRACAPVPLVETLVVGAMTVAEHGSPDQQAAWLPRIVSGDLVVAAALEGSLEIDEAGRVSGDAGVVGWIREAGLVLAVAARDEALAVVAFKPTAEGVQVEDVVPTNRLPAGLVTLSEVEVEVLATGRADVEAVVQRAAAATCSVAAGVCEGAVRMTAAYTSERKQFDRRIAEFQAVAQRAADAFIDTEMITLTARQACYRLSAGLDASKEVHVAKFWAGDGGMRVVHAAQHLHGGIGVDLDYPVHRFFLWAKRLEHTLGTPTRELIQLGAELAAEPV